MRWNNFFFTMLFFSFCTAAKAQTQFRGWLASFNSFKLNNKWSIHFDGQLRSGDQIKNIQTILLRPGINYHINKNFFASLGYAYVNNRRAVAGVTDYVTEHRIWEQVVLSHKWKTVSTSHRFRLEQRFLPLTVINGDELKVVDHAMAHRFRYFIRNIVPLQNGSSFTTGLFFALQDEVFLNIANQNNVNGKTFDQNRLYTALGYRFGGKMDLETGYLYQYIKTATGSVSNHIAQLAVYKRL